MYIVQFQINILTTSTATIIYSPIDPWTIILVKCFEKDINKGRWVTAKGMVLFLIDVTIFLGGAHIA